MTPADEIERLRKLLDRIVVRNPDGSVGIRVTEDALNAAAEYLTPNTEVSSKSKEETSMNDIYRANGYEDREDYLSCLAEDYGIALDTVKVLADLLGPNEDFDGLVSQLEDMWWVEGRW